MHSYIGKPKGYDGSFVVLILVVMEDALVRFLKKGEEIIEEVLILVVMEDALVRPP